MIFFYIRHGEPIYNPDSLTPLGEKQAEAVAQRLSLYGIDKIYSSSSNRAIQTAKPLSELAKIEITTLEFANENLAWKEFSIQKEGQKRWIFQDPQTKELFADEALRALGTDWYCHPEMVAYKKGMERVYSDAFAFFKELGYEHIKNTGKYKIIKSTDARVALFAHEGFGLAFLSAMLDIPYPLVATHFNLCHAGITIIEFKEKEGYAIPKILTLSSNDHLKELL